MRRREFITLLAGATLAWPLAACAQQDDQVLALQGRLLQLQAEVIAAQIGQFFREIESQVGWTTHLSWSADTMDQRRFDGLRLLRQVPAISELSQLDSSGKAQLHVSRLVIDRVGDAPDLSQEPRFTEAMANKVYYGPVYLRRQSELYMTLALAGTQREAGVSVAEVSLKLVWDVATKRIAERGVAYILDAQDRVIAHPGFFIRDDQGRDIIPNPDLSFQRDFSALAQVRAARAGTAGGSAMPARDIHGRDVIAASAPVAPLDWLVFVEVPAEEINAPAP